MAEGTEVPQPLVEPKAQIGEYLSDAWDLLKANFVLIVVGYLVAALIATVACGGIILGGPLGFGFIRVIQKRLKGEEAQIGDIFQGFKDFGKGFVTMLLLFGCGVAVMIPVAILVFILSYIPILGALLSMGLYLVAAVILYAATMFMWPIAALTDASPMDALKQSFKFFQANLVQMLLLTLVLALVGMAGVLACGVGAWVTFPLAIVAAIVAYNKFYLPNAASVA